MTSSPPANPSASSPPKAPRAAAASGQEPLSWSRIAVRVFVLVGVLMLISPFFGSPSVLPEGTAAPAFRATLDDRTDIDLHGGPGHPLVLSFWASWCGPCRAEAPTLSALHERGIPVVGINVEDDPPARVVASKRSLGMTFPIIAGRTDLADLYRVEALPTTYVLAADGTIVLARTGGVSDEDLSEAIAQARAHGI